MKKPGFRKPAKELSFRNIYIFGLILLAAVIALPAWFAYITNIENYELSLSAGVILSPATAGPVVSESFETSVPGIFACGNVLHVHDLVDHVSNESFLAGQAAAAFVRGMPSRGSVLRVVDGNGVRGTVPQLIHLPADRDVSLMFRPSDVFRNSAAVVSCGDRELLRKKAMIYTPGEMAVLTLKASLLADLPGDVLTVRMERS